MIYPNDGAAYFKARFRLVVFRPFVGEVLTGTLVASSR
jgi:DNA-directed RNA polymerase III subunit RPC8